MISFAIWSRVNDFVAGVGVGGCVGEGEGDGDGWREGEGVVGGWEGLRVVIATVESCEEEDGEGVGGLVELGVI